MVVVLGLRAPGNDRSVVSGTTKIVRPIRAAEVFSDASFPLTTVSGRRSAGGRMAGDAQGMSDASRRSVPDMGLPRLPRSAVSRRTSRMQRQREEAARRQAEEEEDILWDEQERLSR